MRLCGTSSRRFELCCPDELLDGLEQRFDAYAENERKRQRRGTAQGAMYVKRGSVEAA